MESVHLIILGYILLPLLVIFPVRKIWTGKRRDYIAMILVLISVAGIMTLIVCNSCSQIGSRFILASTFFACMWVALWLGNDFFSEWISARISWTQYPVKMFFIVLAFTIAYTILSIYVIVFFYRWVLDFRGIGFSDVVYSALIITFIISMFMHGRSFLLGWKQSVIDTEEIKRQSITAQYESLKSQVNPHFLFNSLNALTNLVYEDQDKAARFIKQLSEVYRYVLDTRNREVVPLEEELRFLESYVYLQQIRFGNNLVVEIDRELTLHGKKTSVVPLALQMLIENAIKHNVVSTEAPLRIKLAMEPGCMVIENNLQEKKRLPEESPGLGLGNIQSRYSFLSTRKVEIHKNDSSFVVKIPVLEIPV